MALGIMLIAMTSIGFAETFSSIHNVALDKTWTIVFGESVSEASITKENIKLTKVTSGSITYEVEKISSNEVRIIPSELYEYGAPYRIFVSGVRSESGKGLTENYSMNFFTIPETSSELEFCTEAELEAMDIDYVHYPGRYSKCYSENNGAKFIDADQFAFIFRADYSSGSPEEEHIFQRGMLWFKIDPSNKTLYLKKLRIAQF